MAVEYFKIYITFLPTEHLEKLTTKQSTMKKDIDSDVIMFYR